MNRAQLLLSVLTDGKPHSRAEVFEQVGFMLTNNAASELRAQGYDVQHTVEKNVHVYKIGPRTYAGPTAEPLERANGWASPVGNDGDAGAEQIGAARSELTAAPEGVSAPAAPMLHLSPSPAAALPWVAAGQLTLLGDAA